MTVHFMCSCGGRTYSLPDNMAGMKVRCPTCRTIIIVPQPNENGQVVIAVPAEDQMPGEGGEW